MSKHPVLSDRLDDVLDEVFSTDDALELALRYDRDTTKVAVDETLARFDQVGTRLETDHVV